MSETITRQVQRVILEIYKEFQRVCDQHNLRYYAIGGTCIGAVRHQGFIPWDDDIDVAMPYEDYQKLRSLRNSFQPPFEFYDYNTHKFYNCLFFKLHDVNTTFIEQSAVNYPDRFTGCYIDIMPICAAPDYDRQQVSLIQKALMYGKLNHAQRFPIVEKERLIGKALWLSNVPFRLTKPFNYWSEKMEQAFSQNRFGATSKILFGWRHNRERMLFDYADFCDYIKIPFEDTTMRVPIGYDNYLRKDFGDYMTLSPEKERVSMHPTAVIDLQKSFREYAKEGIKL